MKSVLAAMWFTLLASVLAAQSIDLMFAWPAGLRLRADCEFRRENTLPAGSSVLTSRYSFVWSLREHPKGLALDFTDYRLIRSEPVGSLDPLVRLDWTSLRVSSLLPTLVIDVDAQPVALERLDELKRQLETEFAEIDTEADPQAKRMLSMLTTDEQIQVRALEDWNRMVQIWAGSTGWSTGESITQTGDSGTAAGVQIANEFIYSVVAGSSPKVVVLQVVQRPHTDQIRRSLTALLGADPFEALQLGPDAELVVENTFSVETDPRTLIPTSYRKEKVVGALTGTDRRFVGRKNIWTYRFSQSDSRTDSTGGPTGSSAESVGAEEATRVLADVRRLALAVQKKELDTVFELTHPRVIELAGGPEKFRMVLEQAMVQLAEAKLVFEHFSAEGEPEFFSYEGIDFVISRTRSLMSIGDKRVESRSFMLGSRTKERRRWAYVDGSQLHGSALNLVFPDFPRDRPLPQVERKLVQ